VITSLLSRVVGRTCEQGKTANLDLSRLHAARKIAVDRMISSMWDLEGGSGLGTGRQAAVESKPLAVPRKADDITSIECQV
jgi:hypothetical protein